MLTNEPVTDLEIERGRVVGVRTERHRYRAQHVVLATPIGAAQRLVGAHFAGQDWCRPMLALQTMSASTLQLELEAPAYPIDRAIFGPGTGLASFAEQSRTTFKHAPGRLSIILIPPEQFLAMASEELYETVIEDAR